MKAKVVYHDGYVKIEYQHGGTRTRKSTGITVPSKAHLKANGELKSTVNGHKEKQNTINAMVSKAQNILSEHLFKHKADATGEQFKRAWIDYDKRIKGSKNLMIYYNKFYESKQTEFSREGFNDDSIKDYRNIRYYLEDYKTVTKREIYIDDINRDWLNKFVVFMETEREDYDKSRRFGGKYWSKGGLAGQTVKKRMGLFLGFFNWLDRESHFPYPKTIAKFFQTLDGSETVKAVLNKEEVNELYHFDFRDEKLNYIKDIFVFACFSGMRWKDLCSFNEKDVQKQPNIGEVIEKQASKTKRIFCVPLNSITKEIIKRYSYDFGRYENANFNKYLKVLLKKSGWFDDETKFKNEKGEYLKRWECVSIHRGRDSFCTMLINDRVPVNEIMKYTGHKSVSSLNKYIDLKSQVKNFTNELVL